MSRGGNPNTLIERQDKDSEARSIRNLLLSEGAEIVGILKAATPDALILRCSRHDTAVSVTSDTSDILEKATQLVGRKVAILHFNHRFYIREVRDQTSFSETPIHRNRKTKRMKHFPGGKCCEIRRCSTEKTRVSNYGHTW